VEIILTKATVDRKHRILIDKKLREKIGLKAGDTVVIIPEGREIRIIPVKTEDSFTSSLKGIDYSPEDHSATESLTKMSREE